MKFGIDLPAIWFGTVPLVEPASLMMISPLLPPINRIMTYVFLTPSHCLENPKPRY